MDFPQAGTRRSSLAFRKNEQIHIDNTRRMSLLDTQTNGELNKNLKNLVVKVNFLLLFSLNKQILSSRFQYDHIDESIATDLQSKHSVSEPINNSCESVNQLRPALNNHRPSQSQTKKTRDSVPYRVI